MSRQKSKLKAMAEAGDPWAIKMLAQARGQAMQRSPAKDAAFSAAMRDAADIREWTDGPRAASWRIYRLAQAMIDARR
jgi:hypothetical protein